MAKKKNFQERIAALEKEYGCSPEEVLFKMMLLPEGGSNNRWRLKAAAKLLEKKFPTPKHVYLFGMDGGNIHGTIKIDISTESHLSSRKPVIDITPPADKLLN